MNCLRNPHTSPGTKMKGKRFIKLFFTCILFSLHADSIFCFISNEWRHGVTVFSTIASKNTQRSGVWSPGLQCEVFMFFLCPRGFAPGPTAFSRSPKTWVPVWMVVFCMWPCNKLATCSAFTPRQLGLAPPASLSARVVVIKNGWMEVINNPITNVTLYLTACAISFHFTESKKKKAHELHP